VENSPSKKQSSKKWGQIEDSKSGDKSSLQKICHEHTEMIKQLPVTQMAKISESSDRALWEMIRED
jgi:hypothetical protein